jgi:hypothetical protein
LLEGSNQVIVAWQVVCPEEVLLFSSFGAVSFIPPMLSVSAVLPGTQGDYTVTVVRKA